MCGSSSSRRIAVILLAVAILLSIGGASCAQSIPVTGTAVPRFAPVERTIEQFMGRIGCQAATVAVSVDNKLMYSRGFGYSDAHKKKPTAPDALMRIAGLTQPITATAAKKLIRDRKLSLDTKVFAFLNLKVPRGVSIDPRWEQITIEQLLEHKAGWDTSSTPDPFAQLPEIEKQLHLSRRARPADVIRYMLGQPLQFDPGLKVVRSNFGYCLLGRVIEKASGKQYGAYVVEEILRPLGIDDVKLAKSRQREHDPREVWYPVKELPIEVMDSFGGLVASAPALCKFFEAYWANGEPRHLGDDIQWTFLGNLAGTTALVRQRNDGYIVVVLCNARREGAVQDEDAQTLSRLVDESVDAAVRLK